MRRTECIVYHAPRGNLLSRSLVDIAKPDDFVKDSEYLQTLVVCVPRCVIMMLQCVMSCVLILFNTGVIIEIGKRNMKL